MKFIEQLGQQIGGQAVGAGLGMIFGGLNDKRQLKQQQALMNQQIAGQKEMTDYQRTSQLQMWKDTNYNAQKEEIKKAGLNPALLYGMSGGGGATIGGGTPSVNGGTAAGQSGEIQGMAMQNALMAAQIENIKADTANKLGDAANKPKVGTNLDSGTKLNNVMTELKKTEGKILDANTQNLIQLANANMLNAYLDKDKKVWENDVNKRTFETVVQQRTADLLETDSRIELNKTNKELGDAKINEISEKIKAMWSSISIDYQMMLLAGENAETNRMGVNVQRDRLIWDKTIKDISDSAKISIEQAGKILQGIIGGMTKR